MRRRQIFMLKNDLGLLGGGIVRAMLMRAAALSRRGYPVTVLTLDEGDYSLIVRGLRLMGRLSKRVEVLNIYADYASRNAKSCGGSLSSFFKWTGGVLRGKGLNSPRERFQNGTRVCCDVYHFGGTIHKRVYYQPDTQGKVRECFYTRDSFCYLELTYDAQSPQLQYVTLYDRETGEQRQFRDLASFHTYWLSNIFYATSEKPIVICDSVGSTAAKLLQVKADLCYRVFAIHSNHLLPPHDTFSSIRPGYSQVLQRVQSNDALVVLTECQKEDIATRFGGTNNIFVIPHFLKSARRVRYSRNHTAKAVMVSRYHPDKGLNEAVAAFASVARRIPDATLEIYGAGKHRKDIEQLVQELNLQQNVLLKGYRVNVKKVYERGAVSMLTSTAEGFCLAILESLWYGTPVVSYDIKYGPSDLIKNGHNGFLTSNKKPDELADRLIYLFEHSSEAHEMGKNGATLVQASYTEDIVVERWLELFSVLELRDE